MNKKTLFIIIGIVVIVGGIVTTLFIKQVDGVPYELTSVQRGNIVQEVSASGKVESPTKIDLHFKNSGKLTVVNAKIGIKVFDGQLLVKQDTTQLDAQASEMQAGIDLQKAKLHQLLVGVSTEDIGVSETAMVNAKQALEDAKNSLINTLKNSYTKSDDAVRGKSDQLFSNPTTFNPQLVFIPLGGQSDGQLENDVERGRALIESTLNTWIKSLSLVSNHSDLSSAVALADQNTDQIKLFLNNLSLLVNALTPDAGISQTTIDKWKNDISVARTNVDTAISNLLSAKENLKTKEAGLKTADVQLTLKKAPIRPSDIAVYQAQINQAEASLEKIQAQREDFMIFAPSSGIVTEVNGEVGEIIGPDKTVISFGTGGALQIKLNIVEDNIVGVRVGQEARITFDAMEDQEFHGKVVAIDPAETIVGGAVYYQTTILFDKDDERVMSGMTANVWIKIAVSENTLFIPESAIRYKDGIKIVQVLESNNVLDREIVTGIKNNLGMIEVTSGLLEGEQILLSDKK